MKILIGSGWWCDEKEARKNAVGDKFIRSSDFFRLWLNSLIEQNLEFEIFITDSNSPIKPEPSLLKDITFVSLNENAGHSISHKGFFCGWTRSVIMSMTYCMCGDYDYFVYIEQDALLKGNVIEAAIKQASKTGASFGFSEQTAYQMQVSFFVIKQSQIRYLLKNLYMINQIDNNFAPENKLSLILSKFNFWPLSWILTRSDRIAIKFFRFINKFSFLRKFDYLPFGYGRERPINFDDNQYYFQQATKQDINQYINSKKNDKKY